MVPWDIRALSPAKLASFYKLVGGNYDALFVECPVTSLGFIYRSLGCFHILQQGKDPFAAPSIPALTPAGFVRWQTVQLLLNPQEHVPYLQEAVKRFEILNTGPGGPFPKILPAECLPRTPDIEMAKWHERVGERLRIESEVTTPQSAPPTARPQNARPTELESVTDSSIDNQSLVDASEYFKDSPTWRSRATYNVSRSAPFPTPGDRRSGPQSPQFVRKDSHSDTRSPKHANRLTHTSTQNYIGRSPRKPRPASVESVSSSSSSDSSPPRRTSRRRNHSPPRLRTSISKDKNPRSISVVRSPYPSNDDASPLKDELGRRHSSHVLANWDRRESMPPPPPPANPAVRASNTLSPPFFAAQNGRMSKQPSPTGPTVPPGPTSPPQMNVQSAPLPQGAFASGQPRNSVSHGSGPINLWRNKLNAYVNGSTRTANSISSPPGDPGMPSLPGGIRRSRSGDINGRDPIIEGVRFVDGVGGDWDEGNSRTRRRRDHEREWESEREDRRRERRERRRSGGVEES